jgi:Serine dehydrogenase proteinase
MQLGRLTVRICSVILLGMSSLGLGRVVAATRAATDFPPTVSTSSQQDSAPKRTVRFLEVPLIGRIGEEVQANGIAEALRWADNNHIQHIVFSIDTPGGSVEEWRGIAQVLDDHDDALTYTAYVKNAMSAGSYIALACHNIVMHPTAVLGGAVAYSTDDAGAYEVSAKFNSILASQVAAVADLRGHSGILAQAMIVMEREAYAHLNDNGQWQIMASRPQNTPIDRLMVLDTAETVLTLSAADAEKLGVATLQDCPIEKLNAAIGIAEWRSAGNRGKSAMLSAYRRFSEDRDKTEHDAKRRDELIQRVLRDRPAVIKYINDNTSQAQAMNPRNHRYPTDWESGYFTSQGHMDWQRNTNDAIAAWRRVLAGIDILVDLERLAKKLDIPHHVHEINVIDHAALAEREIDRLWKDRFRTKLD